MVSQEDVFHISGPVHLLNSVDWKNPSHRRSIAASLVQGVYVLEKDRERNIKTPHAAQANASPWWEQCHFKFNRALKDPSDSSYFCAIFEPDYDFYQSTPLPPKYVLAFRGTILSSLNDIKLDIKCFADTLEKSSRFRSAYDDVRNLVKKEGPTNVWLVGHSLGASFAMLVGRILSKSRCQLETYLFNPPIIVLPIHKMIKKEKLKQDLRIASSVVKAGIAMAINHGREDPQEDMFKLLSAWMPHIFVNPSDTICAEFIGYFEHRAKMEEMGIGGIERLAMRYSSESLFYKIIGRDSEPLHLLPTAYMTVNTSQSHHFRQAHGIEQWWQDHSYWQCKLYKL